MIDLKPHPLGRGLRRSACRGGAALGRPGGTLEGDRLDILATLIDAVRRVIVPWTRRSSRGDQIPHGAARLDAQGSGARDRYAHPRSRSPKPQAKFIDCNDPPVARPARHFRRCANPPVETRAGASRQAAVLTLRQVCRGPRRNLKCNQLKRRALAGRERRAIQARSHAGKRHDRARAFPKPRTDLKPNTADFERLPYVKPTGFREYDARWLFPQDINLMGMQAIGLGVATLLRERGVPPRIVTGHDYRAYSSSDQICADFRPARGRRRGSRHRARAFAHSLFRAIRA